MRWLFAFFLSTIFLLLSPGEVQADDKFTLAAKLNYEVHPDGITSVTQEFNLKNNTTDYYVKNYQINIGDSEIYNLHASDDQGLLPVNQIKNGKLLQAQVFFRQQILGLGQTYHWSVTYDTPAIAHKVGRLWEIDIPKPNLSTDVIPYNLNLVVPASFGPALSTSPEVNSLTWTSGTQTNVYSAVFDPNSDSYPYQSYNFHFKYQLYNSRLYPITTDVPLPPDTEYQKIFLYYLNPHPQDVVLDADGNWLARYYLGPAGRLNVEASGSAAVLLNPVIKPVSILTKTTYLEQQDFWPRDNKLIQLKSQQLGTPRAIFDYIVGRVNLTGQSQSRLGGKTVFLSSQGTNSLDFADLFVTMNRALEIPTREVTGFSWQNGQNVLQTWAEFYDNQTNSWQMADPYQAKQTPGKKIDSWDNNHLAVVIYGKDSRTPGLPLNPQQVSITPTGKDLMLNELPKIAYHANIPDLTTAGFAINAAAFLENLGPTISSGEIINLAADNITVAKTTLNSGPLPPFAERQLNLPISSTAIFSDTDAIIKLDIDGHLDVFHLKIQPIYKSKFIIILGGLTLAGLIAIATQITRSLLLQKRRGSNTLRRKGE